MPKASNSRRFQPEPSPSTKRPPADLVDRRRHLGDQPPAGESPAQATSGPSLTRSVAAASALSSVHASHGARSGSSIQQVVADPDRVEPDLLGRPRHREVLGPAHLALDLGELNAYAHAAQRYGDGAIPVRVDTPRLTLQAPLLEDVPELQRVHRRPAHRRAAVPGALPHAGAHRDARERALEHWDERGFGPWLVWRGDELIGRAGLMTSEFESRPCVEAKWFLSPDHWGRGYATEAARAGLEPGFAELGLEEILAWTMTTNLPSQAVMARLGFESIGEIERAGLPHVAFALKPLALGG